MERRQQWLREHPLCVHCEALTPSRTTAAAEVDHVIPLSQGGADDESNFQSLCVEHHLEKSKRERGHAYHPKHRIGVDGWPE